MPSDDKTTEDKDSNSVMKGRPWVRTITFRDAPSEYYLRTGNILAVMKYLSREQIESLYSCSVDDWHEE